MALNQVSMENHSFERNRRWKILFRYNIYRDNDSPGNSRSFNKNRQNIWH